MVDWYVETLGQRILVDSRSDNTGLVYLVDPTYEDRQCVNVLATPDHAAEHELFDRHGPVISSALYQAVDVAGAYDDALASGMEAVHAPMRDDRTGAQTAMLREPSGNPDPSARTARRLSDVPWLPPCGDRRRRLPRAVEFYSRLLGLAEIERDEWQAPSPMPRPSGRAA